MSKITLRGSMWHMVCLTYIAKDKHFLVSVTSVTKASDYSDSPDWINGKVLIYGQNHQDQANPKMKTQ